MAADRGFAVLTGFVGVAPRLLEAGLQLAAVAPPSSTRPCRVGRCVHFMTSHRKGFVVDEWLSRPNTSFREGLG